MATVGLFMASPIVAVADACLNARHRAAACRRCVDTCPADAIALVDDRPQLDAAVCLGCGACMPSCPTQALVSPRSDRSLHLALADSPAGASVRLACQRGGTDPTSMPTIRHDRCLAALGAEELLGLAGDDARHLWLDDTPCATCDLAGLHAAIECAAAQADQIRAAFGLAPVVHRTSVESAAEGPEQRPAGGVTDANGGAMSRRGLFRRLIDLGSDSDADIDGGAPERRRQLLRRLRRWTTVPASPQAPATSIPGFGAVQVDAEQCSACGLCATFCPTDALSFDTAVPGADTSTFALAFDPSQCIDCGLCAVACPENAVTVEPWFDPAAMVSGSSTVLVSGPTATCAVCGAMTTARTGTDDRCFGCRGGVVSPLRDEIGLMADLLGRLPQP